MNVLFCLACGAMVLVALPPFLMIAAHLVLGPAPDID